ncbi:hypothetical protein L9F63_024380 [Diploptera punctata]|uniref:Uncharacterized protein n=1 Tax=Diploptera punctata TaxID=6984 RepID=A0AAD7ZGS8_DIPPU|nr:hypothetical protein L9F63_024380 [Diploptera punctata]
MGLQKKDQTSQLGNSNAAAESSNKTATSNTNPSTPTAVRDMASPSSVSGGSRSGNNSACSTPAAVTNTNASQEPNSPQVHFSTATTSTNSTSPVQYNSSTSTTSVPPDPKSPGQYNSSATGGTNLPTSTSSTSSSSTPSLQYNANGTSNAPQGSLLPPPPHQSAYESMMLGGYPAGATGTGYAPPPPPAMGYGTYSNPGNQYDTDYARASMYSAFHRPDPHPHPFAPGHPPGFLPPPPPPQSANYYPQNMYAPAPYGTPDPAYYSNPFLNAMHQHPYPTLPGSSQNPSPHPQ